MATKNRTPASDGRSATDEARPKVPDLDDSSLFLNRELSWLRFNERVLEEAVDARNPLLERVNFLSIFASNLDEFFMIREAGLRRQLASGVLGAPPDGLSPVEQLKAIRRQLLPTLDLAWTCWQDELRPALKKQGVHVLDYRQLKGKQRKLLRRYFKEVVFPVLTPLAFDPSHPFPHISNLSINLAVVVDEPGQGEKFARIKVPPTFPRLVRIPDEDKADAHEGLGLGESNEPNFVWLEEVIVANLDLLFPGVEVQAAYPFRVTRDADFEIEEDEASDLLTAMAEIVGQRHFGFAVRLEIDEGMPERIREILQRNLAIKPYQVFTSQAPIGRVALGELTGVDRPELKYPRFLPVVHPMVSSEESLFAQLRGRDHLLFHPYDSFNPVVDFVQEAANDPGVLAIKMTLYRAGPDSPLVAALREARENGKQVSALIELKARFDEANNIVWARSLEQAGVHVVYGVLGLKTHAKMCLVVRREENGIRRYVHLSTGNYNPITARVYTDIGYFTCDDQIADDVSHLFNALTGISRKDRYHKLLVAPARMRDQILERIEREVTRHRDHGDGRLVFRMNALVDKACIQALYRASQAGVPIDLQVRGICCLRPGVPGVSETIRVTSIVGRFLEHTRVYYFHNGGDEEILLGSADLMPRNLDHRVETLFPVVDPRLRNALRDEIVFALLEDNVKARQLQADGTYVRLAPSGDEPAVDIQTALLASKGSWRHDA